MIGSCGGRSSSRWLAAPFAYDGIRQLFVRPRVRGIDHLGNGLARNVGKTGPQNHLLKMTATDLREIENAFSKLDIGGCCLKRWVQIDRWQQETPRSGRGAARTRGAPAAKPDS